MPFNLNQRDKYIFQKVKIKYEHVGQEKGKELADSTKEPEYNLWYDLADDERYFGVRS